MALLVTNLVMVENCLTAIHTLRSVKELYYGNFDCLREGLNSHFYTDTVPVKYRVFMIMARSLLNVCFVISK